MSDDLRRSFRDKIRRRPTGRPNGGEDLPPSTTASADTIAIQALAAGPHPQAASLHPRFVPGMPRVRMTIDIGAGLRSRPDLLPGAAIEGLLRICPLLPEHECGSGGPLGPSGAEHDEDGLGLAHLLEHVAIELVASANGGSCHGVTCAWPGRLDRFDIFLESADIPLARACALLAAAIVRDLSVGADRVEGHRLCRDLLAAFTRGDLRDMVAEDAADLLGLDLEQALAGLEDLRRLGYVDAVSAPFTFSSGTGVLFRRAGWPSAGAP